MLTTFADVVPHFHTHVVFARDEWIQKDPATVQRFLKAWFTIAAYMRDHKAETVKSVAATMKASEKIVDETYATEVGMMSFDGQFDPELAVSCPLPAGGAVIHHGRTIHAASANLSDGPRYAYVLAFRSPALQEGHQDQFPWPQGRATAPTERRRRWHRQGGAVIDLYRRARRKLDTK